jgi:hypothetical protein
LGLKEIIVEDPDGAATALKLTEATPDGAKVTQFVWNAGNQGWTLQKNNGDSNESKLPTWNNDYTIRTEIRQITNFNGAVIYKEKNISQVFPWGEQQISNVLDPDATAVSTTWSYYSNQATNGANYGELKSPQNPVGSWERYTYDGSGRLCQLVTPF